jgi:hypothetical protein
MAESQPSAEQMSQAPPPTAAQVVVRQTSRSHRSWTGGPGRRLLAIMVVVAASMGVAATMLAATPAIAARGSQRPCDGPKTFALKISGHTAAITTTSTLAGDVGLFVEKGKGQLFDEGGTVPIGHTVPGKNHFTWNLRVNGRRLSRGSYLVFLEVFKNRSPTGRPPGPQASQLVVASDGSVKATRVSTAALINQTARATASRRTIASAIQITLTLQIILSVLGGMVLGGSAVVLVARRQRPPT